MIVLPGVISMNDRFWANWWRERTPAWWAGFAVGFLVLVVVTAFLGVKTFPWQLLLPIPVAFGYVADQVFDRVGDLVAEGDSWIASLPLWVGVWAAAVAVVGVINTDMVPTTRDVAAYRVYADLSAQARSKFVPTHASEGRIRLKWNWLYKGAPETVGEQPHYLVVAEGHELTFPEQVEATEREGIAAKYRDTLDAAVTHDRLVFFAVVGVWAAVPTFVLWVAAVAWTWFWYRQPVSNLKAGQIVLLWLAAALIVAAYFRLQAEPAEAIRELLNIPPYGSNAEAAVPTFLRSGYHPAAFDFFQATLKALLAEVILFAPLGLFVTTWRWFDTRD
jgi:hypothetical protein